MYLLSIKLVQHTAAEQFQTVIYGVSQKRKICCTDFLHEFSLKLKLSLPQNGSLCVMLAKPLFWQILKIKMLKAKPLLQPLCPSTNLSDDKNLRCSKLVHLDLDLSIPAWCTSPYLSPIIALSLGHSISFFQVPGEFKPIVNDNAILKVFL